MISLTLRYQKAEEDEIMEQNEKYIYENIISDMSDGVIVIGFDGRIDICNRAANDALNFHGETLVGKSIVMLMNQFEENDEFFELLLDAVYTKKKVIKTVPFRTEGVMRYLRVTTSFLMKNDEKIALIAVISDNTDPVELFIHNKSLANQVIGLMNSFVEVMVTETEERSAYNADHTKNMVRFAVKYLDWLSKQGKLTEYTNENTAPFIMSIWLHDIGKLLIPQEIMDKPDRLGKKIDGIMHRIEVAQLMLEIVKLSEPDKAEEAEKQSAALSDARDLVIRCNKVGYLDEDTIEQLKGIAGLTCLTSDRREIPLLDAEELEAITIVKGTLTAGERKIIESHVTFTRELLSKMEFRGIYREVPFWAAGHHEMLDGSGYPDKLTAKDIPWETRLLTVIDIYEALTAKDRPYKPPVSSEKAFEILRDMCSAGKLDGDVLESFYVSGAWKNEKEGEWE